MGKARGCWRASASRSNEASGSPSSNGLMSDQAFDPRAFVLRKDVHPVEMWSPGARVRIHLPAAPIAATIAIGCLGALAGGAVVAGFGFSRPLPDAAPSAVTSVALAGGGVIA